MEKTDIIVIGAGVLGLSIAERLARTGASLFVLERNSSFGQETSSRNSEVIHAGIYYELGSLKAKLCVEGNILLYELCAKHKIPHQNITKLIVATNADEEKQLQQLLEKAHANGASRVRIISLEEIKKLEPYVVGRCALLSPSTGIIDSHGLMAYFVESLKAHGAHIAYYSNVIRIQKKPSGYQVTIIDESQDEFSFLSRIVINSAGLHADTVAAMAGLDIVKQKYNLKYCKGQYFRVTNAKKCSLINRLVYPVPEMKKGGLGIHATLDLAHSIRLGPDTRYIKRDEVEYSVDVARGGDFLNSVKRFLPFLDAADIVPDTVGIRPKLQGENEGFRDFVIQEETALGLPGFVNLVGIESPGLTASPAIAKLVASFVKARI